MFGELLGAGVSLLGGLMGSKAEKKANEMNYRINAENLAWAKEQFYKLLAEAQRQEKEGKFGYTDARGNRVHYVEGKGWVTDLSKFDQYEQNLQKGEEELQLVQDLPAKRAQTFANIARQRGEGGYADALFEGLKNTPMDNPRDASSIQNLFAAEGINEGYDAGMEAALRNARATGSSNDAQLLAASNRERVDALRKAMANPNAARDDAYNRFATRQGNTAQLYNTFATRASGMPPVEYNPRNIDTNSLMTSAASGGQQGKNNLLNAMGQGMNIQNNYKANPEYGMANTFATLGNQLGSMNWDFSGLGGSSNRYPAAPTTGKYKEGAGLW